MAVSQASMKLIKIVERFELEVLNAGKNYERCLIREAFMMAQARIAMYIVQTL